MHHSRVTILTDAPIFFGQIPREQWFQPDWIDETRAREGRMQMMWKGIIYAGEPSGIHDSGSGKSQWSIVEGSVPCVTNPR
jgi:hypothetical protein